VTFTEHLNATIDRVKAGQRQPLKGVPHAIAVRIRLHAKYVNLRTIGQKKVKGWPAGWTQRQTPTRLVLEYNAPKGKRRGRQWSFSFDYYKDARGGITVEWFRETMRKVIDRGVASFNEDMALLRQSTRLQVTESNAIQFLDRSYVMTLRCGDDSCSQWIVPSKEYDVEELLQLRPHEFRDLKPFPGTDIGKYTDHHVFGWFECFIQGDNVPLWVRECSSEKLMISFKAES